MKLNKRQWRTLADIKAHPRSDTAYYAARTCWWTDDPNHLYTLPPQNIDIVKGDAVKRVKSTGLPCDPRGSVLMMAPIQDFIAAAENAVAKGEHPYGAHGLLAFEAAYHGNCVTGLGNEQYPDGLPTSEIGWVEYSKLLDAERAIRAEYDQPWPPGDMKWNVTGPTAWDTSKCNVTISGAHQCQLPMGHEGEHRYWFPSPTGDSEADLKAIERELELEVDESKLADILKNVDITKLGGLTTADLKDLERKMLEPETRDPDQTRNPTAPDPAYPARDHGVRYGPSAGGNAAHSAPHRLAPEPAHGGQDARQNPEHRGPDAK